MKFSVLKVLRRELSLYISVITGLNALFSMFTRDGIIRSYVSGTSMFSVIAFDSFSHKFSGTGISKFLQVCQHDYFANSVVLCVQLF